MQIGELISAIKIGPAGREKEFYKTQFSSVENTANVTMCDQVLIEGIEFTASSGRTFELDAGYNLQFIVRIAFSELDLVNDACKYRVVQVEDQSELDTSSIFCHYGIEMNEEELAEIKLYLEQVSVLIDYLNKSRVDNFDDLIAVELESIYN